MVQSKEGDRVYMDHGEQVVATPCDAKFNFGPVSSRDMTVFTCERPGGDPPAGKQIETQSAVKEWVAFMTAPDRNIQHVIILLEEDELSVYTGNGLVQAYQEAGIHVHHISYKSEHASQRIWKVLEEVDGKKERVVAHCTHGMGRSGRVAALWLIQKYALTPEEAIEETLEVARKYGVERMGAPRQLQDWIG